MLSNLEHSGGHNFIFLEAFLTIGTTGINSLMLFFSLNVIQIKTILEIRKFYRTLILALSILGTTFKTF